MLTGRRRLVEEAFSISGERVGIKSLDEKGKPLQAFNTIVGFPTFTQLSSRSHTPPKLQRCMERDRVPSGRSIVPFKGPTLVKILSHPRSGGGEVEQASCRQLVRLGNSPCRGG